MLRPNRIKQYIFPQISVTGSVNAETYSTHSLNGEIIKIRFQNTSTPGSIWFTESGISTEIYRKNDVTSGTQSFEFYPFVYAVTNTNVTGSPQAFTNRVINGPITWAASGLTSGTTRVLGPITVFYR